MTDHKSIIDLFLNLEQLGAGWGRAGAVVNLICCPKVIPEMYLLETG